MRKVTLTPSAGGMPVVIYDETASPSDACVEGFKPKSMRKFQTTELFRGPSVFMADRFNQWVQWSFTVDHRFSTSLAAQDFAGNRPYIARAGELTIYNYATTGAFIRYYKTAYLSECEPVKDAGLRQTFKYTLQFNSVYSMTA